MGKKISHGFCGIEIASADENGNIGEYRKIPGAVALNLTPNVITVKSSMLSLRERVLYEKLTGYSGTLEIACIPSEAADIFSNDSSQFKFYSIKFRDTDTEYEYRYCRFLPCDINFSTDTDSPSFNTVSIPVEIFIELPPYFTEE